MKNRLLAATVVMTVIWSFQSCQKSDSSLVKSSSVTANVQAAVADLVSTNVNVSSMADVHSVSVEKFESSSQVVPFDGFHSRWGMDGIGPMHFGIPHIDSCATVTVSSSTYPKEITIDYGSGCADNHGHVKKGKIIISISDSLIVAGATKTITYQNFYIDSIQVELSATVKNLGKNDQGHWVMESTWEQTITKNGEKSVQSNQETIEWISGFETVDKSDDVFYKSGKGSITLNDTLTYSRTITKALLYDASCPFIKSGTVELNNNGKVIVIDYGNGDCDNVATVTANDTTETINLHSMEFDMGDKGFGKHCHGFGEGPGRGKR
jgi:Glycogen synthase